MLALPLDPLPGEIFKAPEGVALGESTLIQILDAQNNVIGTTQGTAKVENVSKKWILDRTHTVTQPLTPDMHIRVRGITKKVTALVFREYYGWAPYSYGKEEVIADASFLIAHAVVLFDHATQYIYEKVFMAAVEEPNVKTTP